MNKPELQKQMLNLQERMDALRKIEATAFEFKLKAKKELESTEAYNQMLKFEQEGKDCVGTWYKLYTEYLDCREKLNAL